MRGTMSSGRRKCKIHCDQPSLLTAWLKILSPIRGAPKVTQNGCAWLTLPRLVHFSRNHIAARVAIEPPDEWPVNTRRFSSATALDTCICGEIVLLYVPFGESIVNPKSKSNLSFQDYHFQFKTSIFYTSSYRNSTLCNQDHERPMLITHKKARNRNRDFSPFFLCVCEIMQYCWSWKQHTITLSTWMVGAGASKWQCYEYAMELTCLNFTNSWNLITSPSVFYKLKWNKITESTVKLNIC